MSSSALIRFVSMGRRSTTITSPSLLLVLPPVSWIIMASSDRPLRKVIAEASRVEAETVSLNVSVAVLLLRLSSNASRDGLPTSSMNVAASLASVGGTTTATFSAMSLAKPSLRDIQQLLRSEHRPLCLCISNQSSSVSMMVTLVLS